MKTLIIILVVLYIFQLIVWVMDIISPRYQKVMYEFNSKQQVLLNLIPFYWVVEIAKRIKENYNSL